MIRIVAQVGNRVEFDCGCIVDSLCESVFVERCSPTCEVYRRLMRKGARLGGGSGLLRRAS